MQSFSFKFCRQIVPSESPPRANNFVPGWFSAMQAFNFSTKFPSYSCPFLGHRFMMMLMGKGNGVNVLMLLVLSFLPVITLDYLQQLAI